MTFEVELENAVLTETDAKQLVDIPDGCSSGCDSNKQYFIRWSRLQKTVQIKEGSGGFIGGSTSFRMSIRGSISSGNLGVKKEILKQISGCAAPGEVLACMGPSGSGKTSLLNALSGRSSYNSGYISINGETVTPKAMKRLMSKIAYVKQADVFFMHLTVRDQLTYTALLRLPATMSRNDKMKEVDRVIDMLRLNKVADSPLMLLSGGEKKRVNIGTELLTDPFVLLLDEPTSGLDSTSAVSLMKLLRNLAQENGKTVVTTIHQPSSAVFQSFDKLIMLSDGCVVYFGTPKESLSYLKNLNVACPDGYNAADHWMDVLVNDSSIEEERASIDTDNTSVATQSEEQPPAFGQDRRKHFGDLKDKSPRALLQAAWDNEAVAEQMDSALKTDEDDKSTNDTFEVKKYNSSWLTQYLVLTHRCLKNSKSAIFTPLNLVKSICIGAVAGLVWWQMEYTERTVKDRSAYFFFTMTYWVFDSMFSALMAFPMEREVILKERASGSYHLSAYFMAKTSSDAPVRLILPFLYMVTSFWMAGISSNFGVFVASVGCTLLSVVAGEALGLLVGAAIPNMERALTIMTISMLALMLLGGFFVENIPSFVSWLKYLSPFKYAFDASLQLVFNENVPCDGSGALENICQSLDTGFASSTDVIESLRVQGSVGFNAGMLLVICCVPRYLAYLALGRQKAGERS